MTKIVEQIVLFLNFQCKKTCQKIFFRRITIFLLTYDSNDSNEYCIRRSSHFFAVVLLASPLLCALTARNVNRCLPLSLSFFSRSSTCRYSCIYKLSWEGVWREKTRRQQKSVSLFVYVPHDKSNQSTILLFLYGSSLCVQVCIFI